MLHNTSATATFNGWRSASISFITGQQTVKHLGVRLGYDMSAACHQTFTGIHQAIKANTVTETGAAPLLDGCLLELGCHGGLVVM